MTTALKAAQREAARCWTDCVRLHVECRQSGKDWPDRKRLQTFTKGRYALYSQTVQMIAQQVVANVDATKSRRMREPGSSRWLRYPYRAKEFFPLFWPAQAVSYNAAERRLLLPMGRGRKSFVFHLGLGFEPGSVKLVWNDGYELHIARSIEAATEPPGPNRACVDLGEIHLAAVVTDAGKALVVSGRGIRSDKRLLSKQLGELARKRSRCKRGSCRWKRLQTARRKRSLLVRRRVRDKRHKATRQVINFCQAEGVGTLYIGDPRGVRNKDCGRYHNQRMVRWEVGKDISYLDHKSRLASIVCSTGEERGSSSRCPRCGHRHKPKGRVWACKKCGFTGPRDVVGGTNMFRNGFNSDVTFPAVVTYRRPSPDRHGRRSSLDTGQSCLGRGLGEEQPDRRRGVSPGLSYTHTVEKLVPFRG